MNNKTKLLPCPLCGGKAEIKRGEIFLYSSNPYEPMLWDGWIVSCKNCKHTEEGVERSEAIAAWNKASTTVKSFTSRNVNCGSKQVS